MMRRLVEYKIISGRTVETRRSWLERRSPFAPKSHRAQRQAGNSSEKKIRANELSSEREAARTINCNFGARDAHIVLKYAPDKRPKDYKAAQDDLKKFFAKLRYEYKKINDRNPKLFWVTANWSPKRNAPASLHHHLIVEADCWELVIKLWRGGYPSVELLDDRGDHSDLAAYLVKNVHAAPCQKKWHCSRNMARPIYTEPEEVEDVEDVQPEKGSVIKEHSQSLDDDGRVVSTYMRCCLPAAPKIRGGKILMPTNRKGGRL